MDTARRVVLVEGMLGLLWVVYGLVASLSTLRSTWWIAVGGAAGIATMLYLEEHRWTDWGPTDAAGRRSQPFSWQLRSVPWWWSRHRSLSRRS